MLNNKTYGGVAGQSSGEFVQSIYDDRRKKELTAKINNSLRGIQIEPPKIGTYTSNVSSDVGQGIISERQRQQEFKESLKLLKKRSNPYY